MENSKAMEGRPEQQPDSIRPISDQDSQALWRIRNTESVRQSSHNQEEIPWEKHQQWFTDYRNNPDNHCFVIERGGRVAGYCRIDNGLVSIAIDPEFHGQGLGKQLLIEAVRQIDQTATPITAEVRTDNEASRKLFESAGFTKTEDTEDMLTYSYFPHQA